MMTDFPRLSGNTEPSARRRSRSESANPPRAKPPALRKPRRETPSQKRSWSPLKNVSIASQLGGKEGRILPGTNQPPPTEEGLEIARGSSDQNWCLSSSARTQHSPAAGSGQE